MNEREDAQSIERRSRVEIMRHKEINDALSIARRLLLGLLFCAALAGCKEDDEGESLVGFQLTGSSSHNRATRLHAAVLDVQRQKLPLGTGRTSASPRSSISPCSRAPFFPNA